VNDQLQPAPAPRFAHTPAAPPRGAAVPGSDGADILADLGYSPARIAELQARGVVPPPLPLDPQREIRPFGTRPRS